MSPKTAKTVLRITLAGVTMLAYGAIHKAEKNLSDKLDERYDEPQADPKDDQES